MKNNKFDAVMKSYFDQLEIDPIEFNYYEETHEYVTKESFPYDADDPEAYYMVVKMINNIGNVVIGTSDGLTFTEHEMLGQIMCQNGSWVKL